MTNISCGTATRFLNGAAGLGRSGGEPLPAGIQEMMESAFCTDFSAVRIHVGSEAGAIGALAFACGEDIFFAEGGYCV